MVSHNALPPRGKKAGGPTSATSMVLLCIRSMLSSRASRVPSWYRLWSEPALKPASRSALSYAVVMTVLYSMLCCAVLYCNVLNAVLCYTVSCAVTAVGFAVLNSVQCFLLSCFHVFFSAVCRPVCTQCSTVCIDSGS